MTTTSIECVSVFLLYTMFFEKFLRVYLLHSTSQELIPLNCFLKQQPGEVLFNSSFISHPVLLETLSYLYHLVYLISNLSYLYSFLFLPSFFFPFFLFRPFVYRNYGIFLPFIRFMVIL